VTGDMLREQVAKNIALDIEDKDIMDDGELVSGDIVVSRSVINSRTTRLARTRQPLALVLDN
jgi:adenylate kinase family enzyme